MYDMSGKWRSLNKYVYKLDSVSKHEKSKGHEKSAAIAKVKLESTVNSWCISNIKNVEFWKFWKTQQNVEDMSCYRVWLKTTDHYQVLYDSASWMRCNIDSDREYEIHNLLDRMEDLRQDILNDKLYDSDTDHDGYDSDEDEDTVFSKLHALSSREWSETFFEMFTVI